MQIFVNADLCPQTGTRKETLLATAVFQIPLRFLSFFFMFWPLEFRAGPVTPPSLADHITLARRIVQG